MSSYLAVKIGYISTWSYENRASKHFVIFLNFACLIVWHMFTVLLAYVVFFYLLVSWLGICVEVHVERITILPPPLPSWSFFPTQNSFFNTSDSYLKSARASSWFRCRLAVLFYTLVTLRKVSQRASCKALRWDKVITLRRICIVQYRIIFSFHLAKRINHPDPGWDRKVRYCSLF